MPRLADVLNRRVFAVDPMACSRMAEVIRSYRPRAISVPVFQYGHEVRILLKIAQAAVCHSINWEFIGQRLEGGLVATSAEEMVTRLRTLRAPTLAKWLSGYKKPERIRAMERASLLRDLGESLEVVFGGKVDELVKRSASRIGGSTGFMAQLDRFKAFREDPLRKKSYVLLQELSRERLVSFSDEGELRPAIDYHVMRLYLRTGRVIPRFQVVTDALMTTARPRRRLVMLLREAVSEALQLTAMYAGVRTTDVNYVEWAIGRSVCLRVRPRCLGTRQVPGLDPDIAALSELPCPYMDSCVAFRNPRWRRVREPELKSRFY